MTNGAFDDKPLESPSAREARQADLSSILPPGRADWRLFWALAVPVLIAAVLIFWDLGGPSFWGDEADCALLARNILRFGLPVAYDGHYLIETEKTIYAPGYLWNQHPWAAHYLCAASFAAFGESNFAARLPFALFSLCAVALAGWIVFRISRSPRAAFLAGLLLALNPQFLLFARQARYFPLLAPAGLLMLAGYLDLPRKRGVAVLLAGGFLFFHSNYVPFVPFMGALWLWALCAPGERKKLASLAVATGLVAALTVPWFFAVRAYERAALVRTVDLGFILTELKQYASLYNRFVAPAVLVPVAAWLAWRGSPYRRFYALVLLVTAATVLFIIPVSIVRSLRYTVATIPLLAMAAALLFEELFRSSKWLAAVLLLLALFTEVLSEAAILGSGLVRSALKGAPLKDNVYLAQDLDTRFLKGDLADYVREMIWGFNLDPVAATIDILKKEAKPTDLSVNTWSPKEVHYYTGLDTMCNISFEPPRGYQRPPDYPDDPSRYDRIWYMRRPPPYNIPKFDQYVLQGLSDGRLRVTRWPFDYPNIQAGNVPDLAVREHRTAARLGRVRLYLIEKVSTGSSP